MLRDLFLFSTAQKKKREKNTPKNPQKANNKASWCDNHFLVFSWLNSLFSMCVDIQAPEDIILDFLK